MSSLSDLYAAVKGDIVALADPLLEESQKQLAVRDDVRPQAAVLSSEGRVLVLGAMTGTQGGAATAEQVMGMLQAGIRQMSRERVLSAVAIAHGRDQAGHEVVVACSVGVLLDLVPAAADARAALAPDARLLLAVPERDAHPVTETLAKRLLHPAHLVPIQGDWRT